MDELLPRFAADRVRLALRDTPAVLVNGPRQAGKTTLVRELLAGEREYVTLDDQTVLEAARSDPAAFVRALDRATLDEIQRAPGLLPAIKRAVDTVRRPGRFLLTGSASVLELPTVAESLAGRLEVVTLLPLSRAEMRGRKPAFLRQAFAGVIPRPPEALTGAALVDAVLVGGYPEMLRRRDPRRRQAWAREYVNAIVHRDVRDVAEVERLEPLRRLLRVLAHHAGQLTNFTQIGGQIGLDDKTTKKYVGVLEQVFLVRRVEPWFRNRLKRLVKTPKMHFLDSGLLAALLGVNVMRLTRDRTPLGPLLETFVLSEILKQQTWADESYEVFHYRDKDQDEVDLVVEDESGALIGLEIKAGATVTAADFKGLRKLATAAGDRVKLGAVIYDGDAVVGFGNRMFAAPFSSLWGG
jgi:predicted AAA+ superfamily ATPase